jgi:c-di-AMP phosphodiesterase-like protein
MYFGEDIRLGRMDATALYSGIVVDTKNFAVQTGVRTFDAAAFLRRSGADPVMVRHLFRSDFDTTVALAKTKARAELFPGGLIVSTISERIPNIQVIAAQAADSLLRIENVRMSILIFQLTEDTVGLSARSTGELNVQVIMEAFGGGGHQNVAGAQVKDGDIEAIKAKVIEISEKYIEENDKDESDSAAGR